MPSQTTLFNPLNFFNSILRDQSLGICFGVFVGFLVGSSGIVETLLLIIVGLVAAALLVILGMILGMKQAMATHGSIEVSDELDLS